MGENKSFALLGVLLLLVFAGGVHAKNLQDEIKAYLGPDEVASYQTVELGSQRYVVVEVDGQPKLAFNVSAELVTNETELKQVLNAYAVQAEEGAFTPRAAEELRDKFNLTFESFQKCNKTFYDFIETNYIWAGFRCMEPSVGKTCDAAIALRKKLANDMTSLKPEITLLARKMQEGETEETLKVMQRVLQFSNRSYETAAAFDPYYKYFFGKKMADDKDCGMNPNDLKAIVDRVGPASTSRFVNESENASAFALEALRRKSFSDVRRLQVRGEEAAEAARRKTLEIKQRYAAYSFPTQAFDVKMQKIERILKDLQAMNGSREAEMNLNSLFSAVAEFNGLEAKCSLLLPVYAEMQENLKESEKLLAEAKLDYKYDEGRGQALEKEISDLKQEISLANNELEKGQEVDVATLEALNSKAAALKAKAGGGEQNGTPFDWFPIIAVFLVALSVALLYLFKFRRRRGL